MVLGYEYCDMYHHIMCMGQYATPPPTPIDPTQLNRLDLPIKLQPWEELLHRPSHYQAALHISANQLCLPRFCNGT